MKFEDNEWIKNVLERMEDEKRKETLEMLRKLDDNITLEMASDISEAEGRVGMGFMSAIHERAREK